MKMKKLKKILSVTLASAMIFTSVPAGTIASDKASAQKNEIVKETAQLPAAKTAQSAQTESPEIDGMPNTENSVPAATPTSGTENGRQDEESGNGEVVEFVEPTVLSEPAPLSEPTASPEPTGTPEATASPEPTGAPEATASPESTTSPEATASPEPTGAPEATASPEPTGAPEATASPEPTATPVAEINVAWKLGGTDFKNSIEWNGEEQQIAAEADGIVFTYTIKKGEETIAEDAAEVKVTEPGTYEITAKIKNLQEGQVLSEGTKTVKFEIKKKTIAAIKWSASETEYIYNGKQQTLPTAAFQDIKGNEVEVNVYASQDGSPVEEVIDAGSYTLKAVLNDEDSVYYVIDENTAEATYNLTVDKKEISVTWPEETTVIYDGEEHALTCTTDEAGLTENDFVISYEGVESGAPKNAGTYNVTAESNNKNFVVSESSKKTTLTIEKRDIGLTIDSKKVVYGAEQPDGAEQPEFTYTVAVKGMDEKKAEEELKQELVLSVPTGWEDAVGEYLITGPDTLSNYNLTYNEAYLIVSPLQVELTMKDMTKYYGANDPDIRKEYTVTIVSEGSSKNVEDVKSELESVCGNGQVLVVDYENGIDPTEAPTDEYAYKLNPDLLNKDKNKNYEVLPLGQPVPKLVIQRLPITITVSKDALTMTYGGDIKPFEYKINVGDNTGTTLKEEDIIKQLSDETENGKPILSWVDSENPKNPKAGTYDVVLNVGTRDVKNENLYISKNFEITYEKAVVTVNQLAIQVTPVDAEKYYQGNDPERFDYNVVIVIGSDSNLTPDEVKKELNSKQNAHVVRVEEEEPEKEQAGAHKLAVAFNDEETVTKEAADGEVSLDNCNYNITRSTGTFTIKPLPVEITAEPGQGKFYKEKDPTPFLYTAKIVGGVDTNITEEKLNAHMIEEELSKLPDLSESSISILKREDGENVGTYKYGLTDVAGRATNFALSYVDGDDDNADFEIRKLPITITPKAGQNKYYGKKADPKFTYDVEIDAKKAERDLDLIEEWKEAEAEDIQKEIIGELRKDEKVELGEKRAVLQRESGENAGDYAFSLTFDESKAQNYEITFVEGIFTINRLPITLYPTEGQSKTFSEKDPDGYSYDVEITEDDTDMKKSQVKSELGYDSALTREAGEDVGFYRYLLVPESDPGYKNYANFEITVAYDTFAIDAIEIVDVEEINSRQDSFTVETNLDNGNIDESIGRKLLVHARFPKSDKIGFSEDIDDYVIDATEGVIMGDQYTEVFISPAHYTIERKDDGRELTWTGYLPAGTVITVEVIDDYGEVVSEPSEEVTVTPVPVEFSWDGFRQNAASEKYVTANNGKADSFSLTSENGKNEWIEIQYKKNKEDKKEAVSYGQLNTTFTPQINNAKSEHVTQWMWVNVVDTLNLVCEPKEENFFVDDIAFAIPADAIQFENRGEEVKIHLPEVGTVSSVEIPGGTVTVSSGLTREFTFPVSWSGKDLIATGSAITVTYTDEAGHTGVGTSSASQSSVSTPITFRIQPELNGNGYLNGRSSTMIVSGTACSCEPIKVTVANISQSTYATKKDVWSDSNGSWEVLFDMTSFPEGQDFVIQAEYMDVSGPSYSITAKYDSFCADATLLSPVYEAMSFISGMVEPNTTVLLTVNGDEQNYYELKIDRFGHFVMEDVPMLFGGMDSFDIYAVDIAGNVSLKRHYEIEEPEDPFEVTSSVNPLGKIFYTAEASNSTAYVATPVSLADFKEGEDTIEIPLLMGMSYEVGTLTIKKTENGITVSSEIEVSEDILPEDYRVENEKLLVYTSRPGLNELKEQTGKEYNYGEEIPLGEDEEIWFTEEKDMTILADDIVELELFDFENSKEYETYQEH